MTLRERIAGSHLYALALGAVGRAAGCSWKTIWSAPANDSNLERLSAEMRQQSRKLETSDGYELWETPDGPYWIPSRPLSPDSLFEMLAEEAMRVYSHPACGVRQGDVVIDGGSNVGTFVRAALTAGASQVMACEPSPQNLECLHRNFTAEAARSQVVLVPKGLWNSTTTLRMSIGNSPAGDSFMREDRNGIDLPVTTIDALVAELHLARVDFIKMDIEGAERHALEGGKGTLALHHPRMAISAYHLPDDPDAIAGTVSKAFPGYTFDCQHARVFMGGLLHSRVAPVVYFFSAR